MGTLRALLAIAIVLNHSGGIAGYHLIVGQLAVQEFYVISGFLITHILLTKYDSLWLFYSNRALRIFVPYWVVLGVTLLVCALIYAFGSVPAPAPIWPWIARGDELDAVSKAFLIFTNLFIFGQDLCMWLVREGGALRFVLKALESPDTINSFNVLTPAWTLAVELMFYMVAPFLVRRNVLLLGAIVAASWLARDVAYNHGFYSGAMAYRFFPFEIALFLTGALCYRLYRTLQPYLSLYVSTVLTGGMLAFVLLPREGTYFEQHPYYLLYFIAALLPAMFTFSRRSKVDRWIGELSYPIYLIHWPVLIFIVNPTLTLLLTLALSALLVITVAAPLDRWRARRSIVVLDHHDMAGSSAAGTQSDDTSSAGAARAARA